MNSYQKLKNQIAQIERERDFLVQDIYLMLHGDETQCAEVMNRWNISFSESEMVNDDFYIPKNTIFIQPAERE